MCSEFFFLNLQCVFVFSCHSFWTSSSLDESAGVRREEGHTGFFSHLNFSREKDSAIPSSVEFLCANDLD